WLEALQLVDRRLRAPDLVRVDAELLDLPAKSLAQRLHCRALDGGRQNPRLHLQPLETEALDVPGILLANAFRPVLTAAPAIRAFVAEEQIRDERHLLRVRAAPEVAYALPERLAHDVPAGHLDGRGHV